MSLADDARRVLRRSLDAEVRAVADLLQPGDPVRIVTVARLAHGMSKRKVLRDVQAGYLRVRWYRCGTRKMGKVERAEAYRYLVEMGATS